LVVGLCYILIILTRLELFELFQSFKHGGILMEKREGTHILMYITDFNEK
jgi:hypothetical protein